MATVLRSLSSSAARRLLSPSLRWTRSCSSLRPISPARKIFSQSPLSRMHPRSDISDCFCPFVFPLRRTFSSNVNQLPAINDPEIEAAIKDLMAMNWDEIPDSVVSNTKKALSKTTDDKAGQKALANVFCAAEASVEFSGVLVSLRMALDDLNGVSGEDVGRLPEHLEDATKIAYKRYITYLDSFGPDETYLRKKVETELGTKMIHLKMRCSSIGSEWGKVTLLGTSGLSGSYVELRA
ncbi:succinate dehydrogenase subunit 5, mitochondrial-like isoform X1 [Canna indica]|uniref:Succinate dehydrogenase subunit 5, mitochondrial-like isoform X1 n=1 Tax=Canna indica TaxID=4628 RepID=A0AAQ3K5V9_9LILI|nr:succinate dehydrogenase subunit 5, mitochondrial-like isoform X1 [Canna indica]